MKWLLALGAVQRQENLSARLLLLFPAQLETIKDISLDAAKIQHYLRFVQRSNVTKRHLQWPVRGTSWLVLKHELLVGLVGNSFPDWASRNRRLVGKNSPGEKEAH